jgi:hypothetical protein
MRIVVREGWRHHNATTDRRRERKSMTNGTTIPQPNVSLPEEERSLPYGEVVEIVECRLKQANELLSNGYKLLGIYVVSFPGVHQETKSFFVRRTVVYVLGRSAQVPQHSLS